MGTNSMHVAKTGLNAQQRRMQVIANNLANVNTTGFKRERVNFETLLYQVLRSSGEQTSADTNLTSAFSVGTGVRVVNADKLFSQGSIVSTDNALDLAIDGAGFFQVLLPDGRIGFTRNGTFSRIACTHGSVNKNFKFNGALFLYLNTILDGYFTCKYDT